MAKKKYIVPTGAGFGGGGTHIVECEEKDAPQGAVEVKEKAKEETKDGDK